MRWKLLVADLMALELVVAQTKSRSRSRPVVGPDPREKVVGLRPNDVCLRHLQWCVFPSRALGG